ncbi:hypothetical protein TI01_1065 [Lysobacter sp. A03]|nr:hypothetical protein TI01_1065 [Lysobacter sp. A03]
MFKLLDDCINLVFRKRLWKQWQRRKAQNQVPDFIAGLDIAFGHAGPRIRKE